MSTDRKIYLIDDTVEVGVDKRKMLEILVESLWDNVFDLVDFKLGSFAKNLAKGFKHKEGLQDKAFELVFGALHRATSKLIHDQVPNANEKTSNLSTVKNGFKGDTRNLIETLKTAIDASFFKNPAAWIFLQHFRPIYTRLLQEGLNVEAHTAQMISFQLPEAFWRALIDEWDSNKEKYKPVAEYFNITLHNPFIEQFPAFEQRQKYYQKIRGFYYQKVMNHQTMQLSDIYLEPEFKVSKRNLPKGYYTADRDGFITLPYQGEHLHHYLKDYFIVRKEGFEDVEIEAKQSRLLLLLGQPGQGKTSFCYRTIYDLLPFWEADKELVFLKLNRLKDPRQFLKTPFDQLEEHFKEENFNYKNGLLILDGLDELYMSEGLTKAEITDFFNVMNRELAERKKLTTFITSRYHYVDLTKIGKKDALIIALAPLTLKQQLSWLEKYHPFVQDCQLTAEILTEIHVQKEGKLKALWELVNQPILLQLVAKADFKIKELNNRGKIYEELFNTLIQRSWDKKGGQLKKFSIEEDNGESFRNFLRALAHRIYQSDKEFITIEELESWDDHTPDLITQNLQSDFKENIGEALKDVLITFYFKPVEEDEQLDKKSNAIEFYHKSLQEYLAMEHIWHTLLDEFLEKNTRKKNYTLNDWKKVLELTWQLSTPKSLTEETGIYLRDIVSNHSDESEKKGLLKRMRLFFPDLLNHHFLHSYNAAEDNGTPMKLATNCFYVYWSILSSLPKDKPIISDSLQNVFCNLVIIQQRLTPNKMVLFRENLRGAYLRGVEFQGADLRGAQLQGTDLQDADLQDADLQDAQLQDAYLQGAQLQGAKLQGAKLQEAYLQGAYLQGAYLQGADLQRADLQRADLQDADLQRADLQRADLQRADLQRAKLQDADLQDADLQDAYLQRADLQRADLQRADLQRAKLQEAKLQRADLQEAKLQGAKLQEAYLQGAYLQDAQLQRADLQGAYLQDAKLQGAQLQGAQLQGAYLQGAYLQGADLQGAYLQDAKINILDWFQQLEKLKIKGIAELQKKYEVNSTPQKDIIGNTYYLVKLKE